jgi:hypothetical protein
MGWALTNGPSADDLASATPTTGIAFLAFLLAAQLLIQAATSRFISVDMAVNGLVANTDLIGNLDGAPLL